VAKYTAESLQNEIETTQSDNHTLRQDILDFKERESQLLKRAKDLEDTFVQQATTILTLVPNDKNSEEDGKSEVKINIDFIENLPGKHIFLVHLAKLIIKILTANSG